MDFIHIAASACLTEICAYHMLQVGGREEICIIHDCGFMLWEESELLV